MRLKIILSLFFIFILSCATGKGKKNENFQASGKLEDLIAEKEKILSEGGSAEGGSAEGGSAKGRSAKGGSAEGGAAEGGSTAGGSGSQLSEIDQQISEAIAEHPKVQIIEELRAEAAEHEKRRKKETEPDKKTKLQLEKESLKEGLLRPKKIEGLNNIIQVSAGKSHTIVFDKNKKIWTFGDGRYGTLGHDDEEEQLKPKRIENSF